MAEQHSVTPPRETDDNYKRLERAARQRAVRNRAHRIEVIRLLGGCCHRCGYDEHPAAIEFHHWFDRGTDGRRFNGSTKPGEGKPFTEHKQSRSARRAPIDRPLVRQVITAEKVARWRTAGVLLCSNCHSIIHNENEEPYVYDSRTGGSPPSFGLRPRARNPRVPRSEEGVHASDARAA